MDSLEKVDYWDSLAEYDLRTAYVMLEGNRYLYVGFMCHQVVEKALKAYHWSNIQSEPDFIHALTRLAKKCGIWADMDAGMCDFLERLEPLNIEARYPTYKDRLLDSLSHERCCAILRDTERTYQWLRLRYGK